MSELLVEVKRGRLVESRHFGDMAIVNRDGTVLWSVGDPHRVTYARSSAKPMQALPLVESGAADYFHMSTEEIALACASHSGEPAHTERVNAFLQRIGIAADKLQCGLHPPYNVNAYEQVLRSGQELTSLHNNCSGKHAAMLAFAKYLGADLDTYLEQSHPVQQAIIAVVQELCEVELDDLIMGTDGCGVPVFALPVDKFAFAFAKFASPDGLPEQRARAMQRIRDAMMAHGDLVAGSGRFCTGLMEAGAGTVLGKGGAEGVYCLGIMPAGYGLCVKVDDGNARAAYPAVVEALKQSGIVSMDVLSRLEKFHAPELRNHKGTLVGTIEPSFHLTKNA